VIASPSQRAFLWTCAVSHTTSSRRRGPVQPSGGATHLTQARDLRGPPQAGGISPPRAGLAQSVLVVMVDLLGGVRKLDGGLLGGLLIVLIGIPNGFTPRLLVDHRDGFHSGGDVSAKRAN
jgi:hypothetical protein